MATIIGERIFFEKVPCWACKGTRILSQNILCPEWNHKVRGRLGSHCPHCGATSRFNHKVVGDEQVDCYHCDAGQIMETRESNPTQNIMDALVYKVYRDDYRPQNVKYVGGCTDYGASLSMMDDKLIEEVKKMNWHWHYHQIADENNILCREIAIFPRAVGYDIKAVF